jgi:hypothetical protein
MQMKAKLLFLLLTTVLIFWGCKKDKYETKPRLEIKEVLVREVSTPNGLGTLIDIDVEVFDKEGDVKDSIFIQKIDAARIPCPGNSILTNLDYLIPSFPASNQKVLFRLKFSTIGVDGYVLLSGPDCLPRRDTSVFRFWVKDLGGNRSDTLTTPVIPIPR